MCGCVCSVYAFWYNIPFFLCSKMLQSHRPQRWPFCSQSRLPRFVLSNHDARREVLRFPPGGAGFSDQGVGSPPPRLVPLSVSPSLLYTGSVHAGARLCPLTRKHIRFFSRAHPTSWNVSHQQGCLESTQGNWVRDPTWSSSWMPRRWPWNNFPCQSDPEAAVLARLLSPPLLTPV